VQIPHPRPADLPPETGESRPAVIEVDGLYKRYGAIVAVDGASFAVRRGETAALLGANGAGKTTTIAMLLGLLLPDAGSIRILGIDMLADRYRALPRMNFSSPYVDLPRRLTVAQNLEIFARLYGVRDVSGRVREIAGELEMTRLLDRPAGQLSAGQRSRVALAKALINRPEVLLLDEPTASLDPDTADRMRGYLMSFQQSRGMTILLASHNMSEVERMCSSVFIMRDGHIHDRGTPDELISRYGRRNLEEVFLHIVRDTAAQ
jgi:ABC-2 type transport system ATP-binding protein